MKKAPSETQQRLDVIIKNTYRTLMTRGQKGCYVYFVDKETRDYFEGRMGLKVHEADEDLQQLTISTEPVGKEFIECIPVYSLDIAAGSYGKPSVSECLGWVKKPDGIKTSPRYFVAQVTGKSMEPLIPDGAFCVFRFGVEGSRNGRIVLAQLSESADPETGKRYSVKLYRSQKAPSQEHGWEHTQIQLLPLNPDYSPIPITQADAESTEIVAEFIRILT